MIQDTIINFLNLPGVIGLGIFLVREQVQSYLHFKKQAIGEEKQRLTCSLVRIIEHFVMSPENLDCFEFPIKGYYAYTYNIHSKVTLVVLTLKDLTALKLLIAKQLKPALKKDINNTIQVFQVLTNHSSISSSLVNTAALTKRIIKNNVVITREEFTIKDFLDLFNHISKFTTSYIGIELTRSSWHVTRPNCDCLENFALKGTAEILFLGETEYVSNLQAYWLKEWVTAFIRQSSRIVKDLPIFLELKCLTEREKRILLFP